MTVKIEKFSSPDDGQMCQLGNNFWSVSRLIWLSRDFEVMEVPLSHLNLYYTYDKLTLRQMVTHFDAVNKADLGCPIILDEDGELMDGRHRIMKSLSIGAKTIKAVRFDINPYPCRRDDNA